MPFTVLNTRPALVSKDFLAKLQTCGWQVANYPVITIESRLTEAAKPQLVEQINQSECLIFTSKVAILSLFEHVTPNLSNKQLFTVGQASQRLLQVYTEQAIISSPSTSALGLLPFIKANAVVTIITGEAGNTELLCQLDKRGCQVTQLPIYRRTLPSQQPRFNSDDINITCVFSQGSLENLVKLIDRFTLSILFSKPLVVVTQSMAEYATQVGFAAEVLVSDNALSSSVIATINQWKQTYE